MKTVKQRKQYLNKIHYNMKTQFCWLIVFLIISFQQGTFAQVVYQLPEEISVKHNEINVSVIPQVELISIVQTIGEYNSVFGFLMTKDSSEYKTDVIKQFTPFKNHPAVKMFDRLSRQPRMLNFSAPSNIMLFTDKLLNLRSDVELEEFVVNRIGGIDSLNVFLDLLRNFAVESSFNKFFNTHKTYYNEVIQNTVKNLGEIDYISELETFYGKKQKSYNIVLVSLYSFVGYGNSLICLNDQREIYNTMGPKSVSDNVPFFGNTNYLKYMIRHEFSHPFINPLTEKNWDIVKDFSSNYDLIPDVAKKNVCGDWQECINEFTVRSVTTFLAFSASEEIGQEAYDKEKSKGVSYLDNLLENIRIYQSKRTQFPDFESYYPEILETFKELK